jgi:hypothetical protein
VASQTGRPSAGATEAPTTPCANDPCMFQLPRQEKIVRAAFADRDSVAFAVNLRALVNASGANLKGTQTLSQIIDGHWRRDARVATMTIN